MVIKCNDPTHEEIRKRLTAADEIIDLLCEAYPWLKPDLFGNLEKQQRIVASSHGKKAGELVLLINRYKTHG